MIDYTSARSVLTGTPATRREPTTDRLDCSRCDGVGHLDGPGPLSTPCPNPRCTDGGVRCFDCASPATVPDVYAPDGDGPACEDCAIRCYHGCGEIATRLAPVADERGDLGDEQPLCDRCAEEEPDRAKRIKRLAQLAVEHDVDPFEARAEVEAA